MNKKGTYVAVRFNKHSQDLIDGFVKRNNVPNPLPLEDIHSTILYSRKHCEGLELEPNILHTCMVDGMEVWPSKSGKHCLVLKLNCPSLVKRHEELMKKHDATYDYKEYKPHITISYDIGDTPISSFVEPKGMILIGTKEYYEDLDLEKYS